jgi:peptidoglycan/xylan/chitin deacetylase (PgdA/CDA1 family)
MTVRDHERLKIATFLNHRGIRATFFVVGQYVRASREVVRAVRGLGHLIGNHTDTHKQLTQLTSDPEQLIREVVEADREILEFVDDGPFRLRPPFGEWDAEAAEVLHRSRELEKYSGTVGWDIDCADWKIGSPEDPKSGTPYTLEQCQENYLRRIRKKRSGVVLLHDWSADPPPLGERLRANNRTLELTKWLVDQLGDDFKFVALDQIDLRG